MKEYKIQLSQSEFIKNYFKDRENPDDIEKRYNELWQFAMPCDCWRDWCQWWAMVSREYVLTHIELYVNKDNMMNWLRLRYNPDE